MINNTAEGDGDIEQYFQQIKIDKLPDNKKPKYEIGDLLEIVFRSDDKKTSYLLKGDYGLVCEILFYYCTDYNKKEEHSQPYYIIEYKLLVSKNNNQYRYISEENLRRIDDD